MEQGFHTKLHNLLKTDHRFVDRDGQLLMSSVIDKAWKQDNQLVKLLLSNMDIKSKFFDPICGALVFKAPLFIDYVSDKDFLSNSYTRFKNKIGLSQKGQLFRDQRDLSLVWPYKDCVLEGGQTKEDKKSQKEIFFNEILAEDEINRFFDPKVLTHWKRHTASEVTDVKEIKRDEDGLICENLVIKGNNLSALHTLKAQFQGKVKLIYIDPPYNTGNDSFKYNDGFNHSAWLTFMKNRLEVAREFLREDGVIFVQCDDNEQAYLKVLMDEMFGRENFLSTIAYQRSGVAGLGQGGKFVVNVTEYINIFAKKFDLFKAFNLESQEPFILKHKKRYNHVLTQVGKKRLYDEFISKSTKEPVKIYKHENFVIDKISLSDYERQKNKIIKQYIEKFEHIFRLNIPQSENLFQHDLISRFKDDALYSIESLSSRGKHKGSLTTRYYYKKQLLAWLKDSAKLNKTKIIKTNKLSDFWTHEEIPKADLANEGNVTLSRGKKPEQLLKRIIEMTTEPRDIVLDYHLGSGTTVAVAHKLNRQYIGIEQLDYGKNDSTVRLQNVINGDSSGISKTVHWQGGGDFIYCELMKYNEAYMDRIQEATSSQELLALWKDISKNSFLNWYVNEKMPDQAIEDFMNIGKSDGIEAQKKLLAQLLNKNQLYVHLSEIEDKNFKVSQEDKDLNQAFFKINQKKDELEDEDE